MDGHLSPNTRDFQSLALSVFKLALDFRGSFPHIRILRHKARFSIVSFHCAAHILVLRCIAFSGEIARTSCIKINKINNIN